MAVVSLATRRFNVRRLLMDGMWHSTSEICAAEVGGAEGCRRLREIRANMKGSPYGIEKRRVHNSSQFEYRIVREKQSQMKIGENQ